MLTFKLFGSSKLTFKKKINHENTTAGTGSCCRQALDPHPRTFILTIKLSDSSKLSTKKEIMKKNITANTGNAFQQVL